MGGPTIVTWRNRRFDPRTRDQLVELARIVKPYIHPTQGSYNTSVDASAGTHLGGGAVDNSVSGWSRATIDEVVAAMRRIGFAAWYRPASKSWAPHIHAISIGCPDLSPAAADQVEAYRAGRNGLANNGPDTGPRVGFTTWEDYLRTKDWLDMATEAQVEAKMRKVVQEELAANWITSTTWADWRGAIENIVWRMVWGLKMKNSANGATYSAFQYLVDTWVRDYKDDTSTLAAAIEVIDGEVVEDQEQQV